LTATGESLVSTPNPPAYHKSQVDFIFGGGTLESGEVLRIEDTIWEVEDMKYAWD